MKSLLSALGIVLITCSVTFAAESNADSESLQALIEDAHAKLNAGKARAACRAFEKAVEVSDGQSYDAQLGLASARLKAKDPAGAVAPALEAERLGTKDTQWSAAAFLAGLALYQSQPKDSAALTKAAALLERSIQLAPDQATPARVTLGFVYRDLGQPKSAVTQLREALARLMPESPMRREARIGLCTIRAENPELAPPLHGMPLRSDRLPDSQRPVKIHAPNPQYTHEARETKVVGVVIVRATIDREGCVAAIQTLKSLGAGLEEAALKAIRSWVFEPATFENAPIEVSSFLTVNFRLDPIH